MEQNSFLNIISQHDSSFITHVSDLQRTEAWHEQRRGRFTGSEAKKLMSCTPVSNRKSWQEIDKIFDLGETAKKYIFAKAMERKRGYNVETATSKAMRYGTRVEEQIFHKVQEKYPSLQEVGFLTHQDFDFLGASPDGISDEAVFELKASTSWDTLYTRHEVIFDQKHQDFWQIQQEMLVARKEKCVYAVAEPPQNLDVEEIGEVSIIEVLPSEIHQKALLIRAGLGDFIINKYLADGGYFADAVQFGLSEFKL